MLNQPRVDPRSNDTIARSLIDDPVANAMALGCPTCPSYACCGGLSVQSSIFDCLDFCCAQPSSCTRSCPNNPQLFVKQRREVGGFDLDDVPRAPRRPVGFNNNIVELIYHGSRRSCPLPASVVALRLADLVNFKHGSLRFSSRA
jgi:hypothetical protein